MKNFEKFQSLENKFEVFNDLQTLKEYAESENDFLELFKCLTDSQKFEVMKKNYFNLFQKVTKIKALDTIKTDEIQMRILEDGAISDDIVNNYRFENIVLSFEDKNKISILSNSEMLKRFKISIYNISSIFSSMSEEIKEQLLADSDLLKNIGLNEIEIAKLVSGLKNDNYKYKYIKNNEISDLGKYCILKSFTYEYKKSLLKNENGLSPNEEMHLILSLSTDELVDFIKTEKSVLTAKGHDLTKIVKHMISDRQLEFVYNVDKMGLTEEEIRKIIACSLENKTKEQIDIEQIDEKYRKLVELRLSETGKSRDKIIPDLRQTDLSIYKDLDEFLYINPMDMIENEEDLQRIIELCKICPSVRIADDLDLKDSTVEQFIEAEKWIQSILSRIPKEWTDLQKIAYIDVQVGKKMSYVPNWDTEVSNEDDGRALWEIITTGYGICNGISQVERYMLKRLGIESEMVTSENHAFLLVKNIDIPTSEGIKKGNTLIDPTWNLVASRYGCRPQHFCVSYEEIRKADYDDSGKDYEVHRVDDLLDVQTIQLDESNLRKVYSSIGIADENGKFPIGRVIEQVQIIDSLGYSKEENIRKKFELLQGVCPEFATCINATIRIMQDVLFDENENFKFINSVASRVYEKSDSQKSPVLFAYFEFADEGKMFYYADKQKGEFIKLSQQEFEKRFACYDLDKIRAGNKNLWESNCKVTERMETSSGRVVEGEER